MNTFGKKITFTSFGESHGPAVGGIIDGLPPRLHIDFDAINYDLERRAGKHTPLPCSTRAQSETDRVEWLSGILNGETLGTPIAFIIRNEAHQSDDYDALTNVLREGHADATYLAKYGIRDWRGGGRASARETAARVVVGAIVKQFLAKKNITITTELTQIGAEKDPQRFKQYLQHIAQQGDSVGGLIEGRIDGLPAGLGEPIFDKFPAALAAAMLSINACKGFDYGTGFEQINQLGSAVNDYSGGALGGITDGTAFRFRCVFKPTPTTLRTLQKNSIQTNLRTDPCLAVRAQPIVEAMTALTVANFL